MAAFMAVIFFVKDERRNGIFFVKRAGWDGDVGHRSVEVCS